MSYQQLLFKKALTGYKVKEIMIQNPIAVSAETTLERLVEDYIWNHRFSSFPILEGGRVKGIISLQQVKKVPRSLWPAKRVYEIMKPIGDDLAISPEAEALEALEKLQTNGVGRLAVIDRQFNLVGYLSIRDLFSLMRLKSDFS
jgi:predicted transcriptional regulator